MAPSDRRSAEEGSTFDAKAAERFAKLALACVHKEYPNKISHVLNSDADVAPPRKLTPAFCGCYDWHSSVHGHWLLVRLVRTFPDAPFASDARDALKQSLTAENLKQEAAYIRGEGRASFERPYGLSWLLQLCAELREWDDPQAREWSANLKPLEDAAVERLTKWLPKLSHPVRIGEHDQTAFGLGLMFDYARAAKNEAFAKLIRDSAKKFFLADKNCPLDYEPSGEDFLSPCLGEADVMRRVLPQKEFANWLKGFMPQIPVTENPRLVKSRGFARPERSEAGASRWIELEPGVDVGRNSFRAAGGRSPPAGATSRGGCASSRRTGRGDRRTLRRRTLARQFRGLSDDATRLRAACLARNERRKAIDKSLSRRRLHIDGGLNSRTGAYR